MEFIPDYFVINFSPLADPDAVVEVGHLRFTVLTPRLIRLEFSLDQTFEDRPSQPFWCRKQAVSEFSQQVSEAGLKIETEALLLEFPDAKNAESFDGLTIIMKSSGEIWQYGDEGNGNLRGTTRTLDMVSGKTELEPGLVSRDGWVVVDDSDTLVFNQQGWLEPRNHTGALDLYFFGHGTDYQGALNDYYLIAGKPGLVPRWVLGNWWSRYYRYSHDELIGLMDQFVEHQVPLSVCIIDMDWHVTETGNESSGWTGYTWNRELFPDPEKTLADLHERKLKVALNLHPAEGVHSHEQQYPEFARWMGVDPSSKEAVRFNCADPKFMRAYFDIIHHPYEEQGVDFWWIDWQQGESSDMPGLDPLWWLNHLHYYDLGRKVDHRPFIFSRWGGLGNHRYPIGFSGDTAVTWESLSFQPFFTATAANVGYGWWSHDIGGHMGGIEEGELYARWVQYGVFSPVLRLHSTNNPFHDRTPWGHDAHVEKVSGDAMRLRHALIPYIYSMAWKEQQSGVPFIRPMYHDYPGAEEAYVCPQQYLYGNNLIAAPFTSPANPETGLSRQVVWLPDGDWYDFFSGEHYPGGRWHTIFGRLEDIPVFAKAGAILPLDANPINTHAGIPESLTIRVFPGADGEFILFEDDGVSNHYWQGGYVQTVIKQRWEAGKVKIIIEAARGETGFLPNERKFSIEIMNLAAPETVTASLSGNHIDIAHSHEAKAEKLIIGPITVGATQELAVCVERKIGLVFEKDRMEEKFFDMLTTFRMDSWQKKHLYESFGEIWKDFEFLRKYTDGQLTKSQIETLFEFFNGAGVHKVDYTSEPAYWVLWNNERMKGFKYRFGHWPEHTHLWFDFPYEEEAGSVPRFKVIKPHEYQGSFKLEVNFDDFLSYQAEG